MVEKEEQIFKVQVGEQEVTVEMEVREPITREVVIAAVLLDLATDQAEAEAAEKDLITLTI